MKKKIVINFEDDFSFEMDEKDVDNLIIEISDDIQINLKIKNGIVQGDVCKILK